jgi:hypothetical protein
VRHIFSMKREEVSEGNFFFFYCGKGQKWRSLSP